MTTIGIDPGINGGISWIDSTGDIAVEKMPDTILDLWELIESIKVNAGNAVRAYLETVHSSPQMGVKSAFTFGNGYGHLEMALTAAGISFERVRPQVWQKEMGCLTKGDKNVSKRKAQELFPGTKVTHAIADSMLIAAYGERTKQ
jgi:hypothetical protein